MAQTYVAAHLYTEEVIRRAVTCGVRSLEPCNLITADTARLAAERGAIAVRTLITYDALAQSGAEFGFPPSCGGKDRHCAPGGAHLAQDDVDGGPDHGVRHRSPLPFARSTG